MGTEYWFCILSIFQKSKRLENLHSHIGLYISVTQRPIENENILNFSAYYHITVLVLTVISNILYDCFSQNVRYGVTCWLSPKFVRHQKWHPNSDMLLSPVWKPPKLRNSSIPCNFSKQSMIKRIGKSKLQRNNNVTIIGKMAENEVSNPQKEYIVTKSLDFF